MQIQQHKWFHRIATWVLAIAAPTVLVAQHAGKNPFNPDRKTYLYYPSSAIRIDMPDSVHFNYYREKGTNWVFEFEHNAKEYIMVADDEFSEKVAFEIPPPKKDHFRLTAGNARLYYTRSCFCMDRGNFMADTFTVTAKKINKDRWEVSGSFVVNASKERGNNAFSKTFGGTFIPFRALNKNKRR